MSSRFYTQTVDDAFFMFGTCTYVRLACLWTGVRATAYESTEHDCLDLHSGLYYMKNDAYDRTLTAGNHYSVLNFELLLDANMAGGLSAGGCLLLYCCSSNGRVFSSLFLLHGDGHAAVVSIIFFKIFTIILPAA